jgi:hypothetical protein
VDKRLVVLAGIGVLSAGWLAAGTPASAAPAAATTYQTISPAHMPNPGGGKCKVSVAYPINTAILTLTPAVAQPTNGFYDLSGTYTCNGQSISDPVKGLDRHQVYFSGSFTGKKRGCTRTSGTMGSFTCTIAATGNGTAYVYTQNIKSNTVVLAPGV